MRDPQAATSQPSFLSDPRLPLTDEPASGLTQGSNATRHPSPLPMGGRSEAAGETLGSEARSAQYDDDDEHSIGGGLPPISEGAEGPLSPNAAESAARSALQELAEKAAEMRRMPSPC